MLEFKTVAIKKPADLNFILGQSHFIKTVEDLYEVLVNVPGAKFGLAFSEASGECKVRSEGNDAELKELACANVLELACGHIFIIFIDGAYPVSVLNAVKTVPEVCGIYCATANPTEVIIAQTGSGRGIMGVVDGSSPRGIEAPGDIAWRKDLLRKIGYKL
ncbi:MAG: adenosine-specific kinase [Candidatus Omnitrophica bacterium]|nr:adenosine-specific kinase [Candidatus Omnitrophota bacterium]MDD5042218.1 adenosine-specific kinase [Candidatus Omnitrophota bacterium]MDD5500073.1 adenosine-specific kinase [Candidatus Omnitrophota bacterium]